VKINIWIHEEDLERLSKGDLIIEYWIREPGDFFNAVQVVIDYDTYVQLSERENK